MNKTRMIDPVLLGLGSLLTLMGVFFIFDAGYPREIAAGRNPISGAVVQQLVCGLLGVGAFIALSKLKESTFQKLAIASFLTSMVGLFLCMVPGIGVKLNGAYRWFKLPMLPMVQPAEFVKLTAILFLAATLAGRKPWKSKPARDAFEWCDRNLGRWFKRALPMFLILGAVLLIEKEPDMGTAAVVLCIALLMQLMAGVSRFSLMTGGALVGLSIAVLLFTGAGYRMERIQNHALRWSAANVDDLGFQSVQAEMAIADGYWLGVGPGNGRAKHVMPAATTDFILATVAEEFGVFGVLGVLTLLGLLCMRLLKLAEYSQTATGRLVLVGVAGWVGVQACVNVMMANSIFAPIGVPLPFISYGGSSLIALWLALGVGNAAFAFKPSTEESAHAPRHHRWGNGRARLSRA